MWRIFDTLCWLVDIVIVATIYQLEHYIRKHAMRSPYTSFSMLCECMRGPIDEYSCIGDATHSWLYAIPRNGTILWLWTKDSSGVKDVAERSARCPIHACFASASTALEKFCEYRTGCPHSWALSSSTINGNEHDILFSIRHYSSSSTVFFVVVYLSSIFYFHSLLREFGLPPSYVLFALKCFAMWFSFSRDIRYFFGGSSASRGVML